MTTLALSSFTRRLRDSVEGEVMDDAFSRGRYATDASIYQIMPRAVVVPRTCDDVRNVISLAREEGVSVLPRGGGTSQCGQTVNDAVVIDCSKHLNRLIELDVEAGTCVVEPGIVLDELNRQLKPHGLWYPIDVSTASRATIGGMAGNNSCGGRSLRYGMMRDNVLAIDAFLADGSTARFAEAGVAGEPGFVADLLALGAREQAEIADRFPKVMRRVGGYNIDALVPNGTPANLSSLLVGSEGTLAWSDKITLKLSPLPVRKAMGVCHFPTFHAAMDVAQHIVKLDPVAV
ncbi:FAD-binding oxidoreductase, partial [Sulfitobacter pontiacus]|uniref:FAD-binding oxidoreductase n=2 Tax=Alphaproteobacteria TaxID=28211 RepID=UPI003297E303